LEAHPVWVNVDGKKFLAKQVDLIVQLLAKALKPEHGLETLAK